MEGDYETRVDIEEEEEEEPRNLKHRFMSSLNGLMSSSIVADRVVRSSLAIHGRRESAIPINYCSIHDHYEFSSVDLPVLSLHKISICFDRVTHNAFCCKSMNKKNTPVDIFNEINIMRRVSDHNGIVELGAVYEDSQDVHLVMELCKGGDLLEAVIDREGYKDSEFEAAMIFRQIMESILYCHAKGVVHRDVKLENIFLASSCMHPVVVKLGDFGLATLLEKGKLLYNQTGTPVYMAPEIFDCQGYTETVDIWSAGVLLYAMLSGRLPFDGDSLHEIKCRVLNEEVDLKSGVWEKISEIAKDLISRMLVKAPEYRLDATQVLRHPWLNIETPDMIPIMQLPITL